MAKKPKSEIVSDFIRRYPPAVRRIMEKVRAVIRKAAPGAVETMGYGVPAYKLNKNLVFFAGFKKHIGFYPGSMTVKKVFKKELAGYELSKGTIRFQLEEPIPYGLISKIVKYRVKEDTKLFK